MRRLQNDIEKLNFLLSPVLTTYPVVLLLWLLRLHRSVKQNSIFEWLLTQFCVSLSLTLSSPPPPSDALKFCGYRKRERWWLTQYEWKSVDEEERGREESWKQYRNYRRRGCSRSSNEGGLWDIRKMFPIPNCLPLVCAPCVCVLFIPAVGCTHMLARPLQ